MKIEQIFCERGCRERLEILKLLSKEGKMTASQISRAMKGVPSTNWRWVYKHLDILDKTKLIVREGRFWDITEQARKLVNIVFDPCTLKLYFAASGSAIKALESLPLKVPYLLSAGTYWRGGKFGLSHNVLFASEIFIDSGAQQFYRKFKGDDFPYSCKEYVDFAQDIGAEHIASLDLPLDILAPRGMSIGEGIERTVQYGVDIIEYAESIGIQGRIVPVLQGYDDPTQWLECLDLYRQHGVESGIWGIGSLCMAKSEKLVTNVTTTVKSKLKQQKIHIFGLALNVLRKIYPIVDSFDTSAWIYWAKMDGAIFVWDPIKMRFIHLQAREGKRYDTLSLMRANLYAIQSMVYNLDSIKQNQLK